MTAHEEDVCRNEHWQRLPTCTLMGLRFPLSCWEHVALHTPITLAPEHRLNEEEKERERSSKRSTLASKNTVVRALTHISDFSTCTDTDTSTHKQFLQTWQKHILITHLHTSILYNAHWKDLMSSAYSTKLYVYTTRNADIVVEMIPIHTDSQKLLKMQHCE